MIPLRHPLPGLALWSLCGLTACGVLKNDQDAQVVVNQRVVSLPAGEFFQAYGPASTRSEQLDGSTTYRWISSTGKVPAGPATLDDRTCTLRLVADRNGKISIAEIVLDNPGRLSTSRCGEMFKAK